MTSLRRLTLAVPLVAFSMTVLITTAHFAAQGRTPGPVTVPVRVVAALPRTTATADSGAGSVDVAKVRAADFSFTGWVDLRAGGELLLQTTAPQRPAFLDLRSLRREDVAMALGDALLYSGFELSGTVQQYGRPRCLVLSAPAGRKVLWKAQPDACTG